VNSQEKHRQKIENKKKAYYKPFHI